MQRSFKLFSFLLIFCFSMQGWSKEALKYPVSQIPVALTDNANSVVRNNETLVEVISPSKFIIKKTYALTILKESALSSSILNLGYGKFDKYSGIEAIVYNAAGEKVKRIRNEDILDLSAIDGGTLYSDDRRIYIDPKYQIYPFTIEYSYTDTYTSAFFLPSWSVFEGYNTAVERSIFTIEVAEGYDLRFKENKISQDKIAKETSGNKSYQWSASNFKARNPEPYSPNNDDLYPNVKIAPSNFEIDGFKGNMETWADLGKFVFALNKKSDNLSKETREMIRNLVKDCKDDEEKVKLVYEYVQKKNRYISIQVGIGGWRSIDAETVDRLSYGDCKALSNYTKSLLEAVGIPAICVLAGAGADYPDIDPSFCDLSFNHMILCVPMKKDSIWLECTSSYYPSCFLGNFTDDRYVLLSEENGGHLVKTPCFSKEENVVNTSGEVKLAPDGSATAQFKRSFCGSYYGNYLGLKLMEEKDRRGSIISLISIPNFKLTNYSIQEYKSRKPSLDLTVNLDVINYSTLMGSRMMVKMNQLSPMIQVPRFVRKRDFDFQIRRNQASNDTVTFQLPEGYQVEALPPTVEINNEFGAFKCSTIQKDRSVQMIRHLDLTKGVKGPEKYNEYREFLEKIAASDNAKCVLVKG